MSEYLLKSNVPLPSVSLNLVNPVRYEFKVVEHIDDEGRIRKAALCVRTVEYDHNGVIFTTNPWKAVDREQVPWVPGT